MHPLISHHLAVLRNTETSPARFRATCRILAALLVPEATKHLPTVDKTVETPNGPTSAQVLAKPVVLVPILRAGLALLDGFLDFLPEATVAHIGLSRDEETLQPTTYYQNIPKNLAESTVLVLDPMLATGGSASDTLTCLKENGAHDLHFVCLLAAPEGLAQLQKDHPDVPVTTGSVEERLDHRGFILPGLGDAGDRAFGTL